MSWMLVAYGVIVASLSILAGVSPCGPSRSSSRYGGLPALFRGVTDLVDMLDPAWLQHRLRPATAACSWRLGGFGFMPSSRRRCRLKNPRGFFNPASPSSAARPPPPDGPRMGSVEAPISARTTVAGRRGGRTLSRCIRARRLIPDATGWRTSPLRPARPSSARRWAPPRTPIFMGKMGGGGGGWARCRRCCRRCRG